MTRQALLIAGTGAMACYFGARLAPYADVTLLGTWPEGLEAVRRDGIRVETNGHLETIQVKAESDLKQCAKVKHALVLVKSWQTERAAGQLARCLEEDGVALTLQNGLGNLEKLQAALGSECAALGVTTLGVTLVGPAHVRLGGEGPIYLAPHARLDGLETLLEQAGFTMERVDDLQSLQWGKLMVNTGINPLTALLKVTNGRLLELPEAREVMAAAARETAAVAAARGVRIPYADVAARVLEVARLTTSNRSSMLQDVLRGAPTEIDAICGAVTQMGEELGIPTPVNRVLWKLVRSLASASQGPA